MSSDAAARTVHTPRPLRTTRIGHIASIVFLGVLPAVAIVTLFASTIGDGTVAIDLEQFYVAARAILDGTSPYLDDGTSVAPWGGPFPYPPLPALLAAPLTVLPLEVAGVFVMAVLVLVALAVLFVLEVRDWRCYGLVLLWPPVISAIQTGNVTLWFALAVALAWRFRRTRLAAPASIGVTLAVKFFLWPVVLWFAATRRYTSAALTCAIGAVVLLVSWGVIGFAGFAGYPDLLRRLERAVGEDSYTAYILGLDLGLSSPAARTLWLATGLGLLGAVVLLGRRGDERTSFVLAIVAALALTPIVWLHYFALLIVIVAVVRPRLGLVWFIPLGMVVTPGSGHPTPFETAWTLAIAALTVALAVWESRRGTEAPSSASSVELARAAA